MNALALFILLIAPARDSFAQVLRGAVSRPIVTARPTRVTAPPKLLPPANAMSRLNSPMAYGILPSPETTPVPSYIRNTLAIPSPEIAETQTVPLANPFGIQVQNGTFHGRPAQARENIGAAVDSILPHFAEKSGADSAPQNPGESRHSIIKVKSSEELASLMDLSRRLLTRPQVRKFLRESFKEELTVSEEMQKEFGLPEKIKEISETQFLLLLTQNPSGWPVLKDYLKEIEKKEEKLDEEDPKLKEVRAKWRETFREMIKDEGIKEDFARLNDPMTPLELRWSDGKPGYSNAQIFANHQTLRDGQIAPPANLKKVLIDFIAGAESELVFNVFDFDLMEVADALLERAKAGVKITGGIDKSVVESRPGVKAVFDALSAHKNITMVAVDSVGLNHQKIVIRDPADPKKARSLFSSGNFTQSCIGPEGDLVLVDPKDRPKDSVPNANHMMVLDGDLPAQVAYNNLAKTLVYQLRGDDYPLGGAFKIQGNPGATGGTPSLFMAFSPKGGLGDINRDVSRRLLLGTRGPVRLLQFAFSSAGVEEALLERARLEKADGKSFDLKTVGDTPFAVRPWSVFLSLAGFELLEDGEKKEYVKSKENELRKILGKEEYEALLDQIRVGPRAYRNHGYTAPDGSKTEYGAKLHHKVMISGDHAVLGTSFNFSEAANSNQEQFLLTDDPALVAEMNAIFDGFYALSGTSLIDEVQRRNEFLQKGGEDDLAIDKQYEHVDKEAGRSRPKR